MTRLNSRHNFTSQNQHLHRDGKAGASPFARSPTAASALPLREQAPTVATKIQGPLREEMAKKELHTKLLKTRSSKQVLTATADIGEMATVKSKMSQHAAAAADEDEDAEEEDFGEVQGWDFDENADAELQSQRLERFLGVDGNGGGAAANHGTSAYSLASMSSSFSKSVGGKQSPMSTPCSPHGDPGHTLTPTHGGTLHAVKSFSKMTLNAASGLLQSISSVGEPEQATLIARSESFMKLHTLTPSTPKNKDYGKPPEKVKSFISTVDSAIQNLGVKTIPTQAPPRKSLEPNLQRDDLFPEGAHKMEFSPAQPAPPEQEYRTLFDVKDVRSFRLEHQQNSKQGKKLQPLKHSPSAPALLSPTDSHTAPRPTGFLRPPPLDLNVTVGGSAVKNQSPVGPHPPMSPLVRASITPTTPSGRIISAATHQQQQQQQASSPLASASSSFLSQALKKTSSFLSMPLPTLALTPAKQSDSLQVSPVSMGTGGTPDNKKGGILSERHKKVIAEASPGVGTPVIYVPQTAHSPDAVARKIFSSMTGLLEVGKSNKLERFTPQSMKHLDLSRVAEAPEKDLEMLKSNGVAASLDVSDVGPDNPVKELDETWSACWDDEAGAVYYYNKISGQATWLRPSASSDAEEQGEEDFFKILNNGLPRGLGEFNLGDSELTIKTRKIAARQKLWTKLRNRYEGDAETEFTSALNAKDKQKYSKLEDSEVLWEYEREIADWLVEE